SVLANVGGPGVLDDRAAGEHNPWRAGRTARLCGFGLSILVWLQVGLDHPLGAWLGGCVPVAAPSAGQTGDCRSGFDSGTGWLPSEVFRLFSARRNERHGPVRLLASSR